MVLAAVSLLLLSGVQPPVLDPAADSAREPFDYFVGIPVRLPGSPLTANVDGPGDDGYWVTREGHLACLRGRLVVFVGDPPEPLWCRVRTWLDAATPVLEARTSMAGVEIRLHYAVGEADGMAGRVGLLRVLAVGGGTPTTLRVAVGYVSDAGLCVPWPEPDLSATYTIESDHVLRDGKVLFTFPAVPGAQPYAGVDAPYRGPFRARDLHALRDTPVALIAYSLALSPRQRRSLVFRLPSASVNPALALPALRRADFDECVLRSTHRWRRWLAGQPLVRCGEAKVDHAYVAALIRAHELGAGQPAELAGAPPPGLLNAEIERGLVAYRAGPDLTGLSLTMTARRARWHLRRGEPERALAGLYAVLLHSSAAHELPEAVPAAWSQRWVLTDWDPRPSSPATAEFIALCRELLIAVEGDEVHLFAGLSPAWLRAGNTIMAERLPTAFGALSARVVVEPDGLTMRLPTEFASAPHRLVATIPAGLVVRAVRLDGQVVAVANGQVQVSVGARELRVWGEYRPQGTELSYDSWVAAYRREYARLVAAFAAAGGVVADGRPVAPAAAEERRRRFEELYGTGD